MKNLYLLLLALLIIPRVSAQTAEWKYIGEIKFPPADTATVTPYLCDVDADGNLYVVSSKATSARAHNAIFKAAPGATQFTKIIDFDNNGDSDTLTGNIGAIRGLAVRKNDVYIVASQPYPKTKPNTVAATYIYPNGDTAQVEKYGFNINGAGYGTYINGAAITKDSILLTGIPFNTSIRFYNFSKTIVSPARGSWIAITGTYPSEPGGPHTSGLDVIRDVATIPGADYMLAETPFYTSRNSYSTTSVTGGIASWTGGNQMNPGSYTGTRITHLAYELSFDKAIPYGITVDKDGVLWVAGTDSTRRWIHGYNVIVNRALNVASLPSKNSSVTPDPLGAPIVTPSDVAFNPAATVGYVTDEGSGKVFKFQLGGTDVRGENGNPVSFRLEQNYPNPFNPATMISFRLQQSGYVRLFVTNALGEVVSILQDGHLQNGTHVKVFDAAGLTSGIYFYTLQTEAGSVTRKMSLLR